MSRVLEALKALQERHPSNPEQLPRAGSQKAPIAAARLAVAPSSVPATSTPRKLGPLVPDPLPVVKRCSLPTASVVPDPYLELAERITAQLAENYCNVLLFVCSDVATQQGFSLTHLAQAFSLQSADDVLLVDGELRRGRLSQLSGLTGPGVVDVMLGSATWSDVIHPTTTSRVDFIARGSSGDPVAERHEFGWTALRPRYRAVLIGPADASQPETTWLATHCDAVYFVVSQSHTLRTAATAALAAFRASGANVLGCVVIDV